MEELADLPPHLQRSEMEKQLDDLKGEIDTFGKQIVEEKAKWEKATADKPFYLESIKERLERQREGPPCLP